MYKIFAYLLTLNILSVLLEKAVDEFWIALNIVLLLSLFIRKKWVTILIVIIVSLIALYNYELSKPLFYLGLEPVDKISNQLYAERIIGFIILLLSFSDKIFIKKLYEEFKKLKFIVLLEIIIIQFVIFYMYLSGKGFLNEWGIDNFVGTFNSPHPYGYSLIVMILIIEWLVREYKSWVIELLYVIPITTALLSGARTPLVAMILILFAVKIFKSRVPIFKTRYKRKTIIFSLFLTAISLLFSVRILGYVYSSSIVQKFMLTVQEGNFTNSRSEFWGLLINDYFVNFNLSEQIFGHGISYSVYLNYKNMGSAIWSHSDIIDIVISFGLIMLIIYLFSFYRYFRTIFEISNNMVMPFILLISFTLLVVGNGIINYTSFISSLAYLSILCYSNYGKKIACNERG